MTQAKSFKPILKAAQDRKGGARALNAMLPGEPKSPASLRRIKDATALSALSKGVFRAGFSWSVVDKRWPAIEAATKGFDPEHIAPWGEEEIEAFVAAPGVIKNRNRLRACIDNARWFLDIRGEHGSFGKFIAKWPSSDIVGLWQRMKQDGSRAGGSTGAYFLRELGKDSWLPTRSVMAALVAHKVLERPTTGKRNMADAQAAFNAWHEETGRSFAELSRIMAYSVPD